MEEAVDLLPARSLECVKVVLLPVASTLLKSTGSVHGYGRREGSFLPLPEEAFLIKFNISPEMSR